MLLMNKKILFSFFYFSATDLVNAKTNIPPGSVNSARYVPRSFASWYISTSYYSPPPLSASEDKCILVKKLGNFEMLKFQNTQKHSIMVILKV